MPRTKTRNQTVLGLDPGYARLGFAVLHASDGRVRLGTYGTLTTPARDTQGDRYLKLAAALTALLRRTKPDLVAIERLFFRANAKTAMAVSESRGVLLLCCAEANVRTVEFTPSEVKRAVTGSGATDKRGVQKMVRLILGLGRTITDDDAADAVAIALAGLQAARRL